MNLWKHTSQISLGILQVPENFENLLIDEWGTDKKDVQDFLS